jgi:hypothetical protein
VDRLESRDEIQKNQTIRSIHEEEFENITKQESILTLKRNIIEKQRNWQTNKFGGVSFVPEKA